MFVLGMYWGCTGVVLGMYWGCTVAVLLLYCCCTVAVPMATVILYPTPCSIELVIIIGEFYFGCYSL